MKKKDNISTKERKLYEEYRNKTIGELGSEFASIWSKSEAYSYRMFYPDVMLELAERLYEAHPVLLTYMKVLVPEYQFPIDKLGADASDKPLNRFGYHARNFARAGWGR